MTPLSLREVDFCAEEDRPIRERRCSSERFIGEGVELDRSFLGVEEGVENGEVLIVRAGVVVVVDATPFAVVVDGETGDVVDDVVVCVGSFTGGVEEFPISCIGCCGLDSG